MGKKLSITKKEAKKLTIEIWSYLRDHPEIKHKHFLPDELYNKIRDMDNNCPLCEYTDNFPDSCNKCPLRGCMFSLNSPYRRWSNTVNNIERQKAASEIVEIIKKW